MARPRNEPVTDSFAGLESLYDAYRPSYPAEAIRITLDGSPRLLRLADVGCGTGISSRLFAAAGAEVIGIEPNDDMRRQAERAGAVPGAPPIDYRQGTAERTGLPGGSVGVVACCQAFHWFDEKLALAEFHRILCPRGRLALIWNVRQDSDALSAGYNRITDRARAAAAAAGRTLRRNRSADPTTTGHFAAARTEHVANPHRLDRAAFLGRARSASYWPREGPLRAELDAGLARLFDAHQRGGFVVLDQVTRVIIAEREPGSFFARG